MNNSTSLVLADPQILVRKGIAMLLQGSGRFHILEEISDGNMILESYNRCRPDIMLMEIAYQNLDYLRVIRDLKSISQDSRIAILTMLSMEDTVYNSLRFGVDAYILKDSSPEELFLALDSIMLGKSYISSGISTMLIKSLRSDTPDAHADERWYRLTPREREILQYVTRGSKTREIASILHRSIKTVEKHRASIKRKLGTDSIAEMRAYGMRLGLLQNTI